MMAEGDENTMDAQENELALPSTASSAVIFTKDALTRSASSSPRILKAVVAPSSLATLKSLSVEYRAWAEARNAAQAVAAAREAAASAVRRTLSLPRLA
jgi:3-polyprenyl-4-hydroxybenzoate decarboxylase